MAFWRAPACVLDRFIFSFARGPSSGTFLRTSSPVSFEQALSPTFDSQANSLPDYLLDPAENLSLHEQYTFWLYWFIFSLSHIGLAYAATELQDSFRAREYPFEEQRDDIPHLRCVS